MLGKTGRQEVRDYDVENKVEDILLTFMTNQWTSAGFILCRIDKRMDNQSASVTTWWKDKI